MSELNAWHRLIAVFRDGLEVLKRLIAAGSADEEPPFQGELVPIPVRVRSQSRRFPN